MITKPKIQTKPVQEFLNMGKKYTIPYNVKIHGVLRSFFISF
ncbi:hypothetical protein HMPREF1400_00277 [Helicobacter pylori GAM119Bi]|nr:hypothetical protein HMPREF1400_00277 [Helicobacter pylori GAM119Bi]EMJ45087.1 hypothetical protein HMPREF1434_00182 [Helicobacter pylori GAMchJs124i]